TIVFDKTGTLTEAGQFQLMYEGIQLTKVEEHYVKSLAAQSSHPLSRKLSTFLETGKLMKVENYQEEIGQGLYGIIDGNEICIGSNTYIGSTFDGTDSNETSVYVRLNSEIKGRYIYKNVYREG